MTHWIVTRRYGAGNADYLLGWDILWGPVWVGSRRHAMTFATMERAADAAETALAIMAPVPWCVPDFGSTHTVTAERANQL